MSTGLNLIENLSIPKDDNVRSNLGTKFTIPKFITPNNSEYTSLFHYTSVGVIDNILKNGEFWASNIYYQNDAMEYYEGISFLKQKFNNYSPINKFLDEISKENGFSSEGIFTISFSGEPDNLHQWITYAKESGICIELDGDIIKKTSLFYYTKDETEDRIEAYCDSKFLIKKVKYTQKNEDNPQKILESIISATFGLIPGRNVYSKNKYANSDNYSDSAAYQDAIRNKKPSYKNDIDTTLLKILRKYSSDAKEFLRIYASYCKNTFFSEEDEYRAVVFPIFEKCDYKPKIDYFVKKNGIVRPYIKVFFLENHDDDTQNYSALVELPIKSITVGPSGNQQAVFDSIVHRVKYGKKKVYNYYEKKCNAFNANFSIYFWESIKRALEEMSKKISYDGLKLVYKIISNDLKKELVNTICTKEWEIPKITNDPKIIEMYGLTNLIISGKASPGSSIAPMDLVAYIKKNNYFTKEGIWIKKSKIPYIF